MAHPRKQWIPDAIPNAEYKRQLCKQVRMPDICEWLHVQCDIYESKSLRQQDLELRVGLLAQNHVSMLSTSVFADRDMEKLTLRQLYFCSMIAAADAIPGICNSHTMWEAEQYISAIEVIKTFIQQREDYGEVVTTPHKIRKGLDESYRSLLCRICQHLFISSNLKDYLVSSVSVESEFSIENVMNDYIVAVGGYPLSVSKRLDLLSLQHMLQRSLYTA
jgi:hypothetical protein